MPEFAIDHSPLERSDPAPEWNEWCGVCASLRLERSALPTSKEIAPRFWVRRFLLERVTGIGRPRLRSAPYQSPRVTPIAAPPLNFPAPARKVLALRATAPFNSRYSIFKKEKTPSKDEVISFGAGNGNWTRFSTMARWHNTGILYPHVAIRSELSEFIFDKFLSLSAVAPFPQIYFVNLGPPILRTINLALN